MFNTTRVHTLIAVLAMSLFSSLSVAPVMAQPTSVQGAIAAGSASAQNPVVIGGVDGAGTVRNARVSASGILSFGLNAAGQDGFTNSQIMYLKDIDDYSGLLPIAPMIFNPSSGNWDRQRFCEKSALVTLFSTSTHELITATSGKNIYICSITGSGESNATGFYVTAGTGVGCATGSTSLTGVVRVAANTTFFLGGNTGYYAVAPVSTNVCVTPSTGNNTAIWVKYTVY